MTRPELLTFDIFGTVLDWSTGLSEAVRTATGRAVCFDDFDRIVDVQGADEQAPPFKSYRAITAASLVSVLGMDAARADAIGAEAGRWPLFADSAEGLRGLMKVARCAAMSNSDRAHGEQVQQSLGFRLSAWICAEDVGCYKPSQEFWRKVSERLEIPFGPAWWHVSAYADYDLDVAKRLGLTSIYVPRRHARPPKPEDDVRTVRDLLELASLIGA